MRLALAALLAAAPAPAPTPSVLSMAWAPGPALMLSAGRWWADEELLWLLQGKRFRVIRWDISRDPAWSPRRDLIAFSDTTGVATIRPDGSHYKLLHQANNFDSWSPNGRRVA